MKYIFLDESGELGFKDSSSKFFIITLLVCNEDSLIRLRRIIKKVRFRKLKKKIRSIPELKGHGVPNNIREIVLKKAISEKIEIFAIILDKRKVYDYVKNHQSKTGGMKMPLFEWFLSTLRIPRVNQTTRQRRVEF